MVLEQTKIWSLDPMGPKTKNDCAGEGQQQFTALLCTIPRVMGEKNMALSPMGTKTKNDGADEG
jgi:hypothetical protein